MIDIGCLAVMGIVVWCVASEGLWGSAHTFLCVLIAGLLAMNYFEPAAAFLEGMLGGFRYYADIVALVGLFTALVFGLRLAAEQICPVFIQLPNMADQIGRWVFAALTGYLTMAVLLTSLHTAPLPREFIGFKPERANFFGMAPDRQWLGFTQYVTERPFGWIEFQDPKTKQLVTHSFDGKYELLGDTSQPYFNHIWPSFPIRYATRRDQITGTTTKATPVPVAVPTTTTPTAPGGGNNAPANPGF